MVAQGNVGVKGVVSCSAGFQSEGKPVGFKFVGIAGTQDMNFLETKQVCNYLATISQPHQFLVFEGKHQWPTESVLREAVEILDLWAMKDSFVQERKSSIDEYYNKSRGRIESLKRNSNDDSLALALSLSKRVVSVLNGLTDVKDVKDGIIALEKNQGLNDFLKEQLAIEKYEIQKQGEFLSAFGIQSDDWWHREIEQLNQLGSLSKKYW